MFPRRTPGASSLGHEFSENRARQRDIRFYDSLYSSRRVVKFSMVRAFVEVVMLSKSVEDVLRTVVCLARDPEVAVSAGVLARRTNIPRKRLNEALRNLTRASLVRLQPRPDVGYRLTAPPRKMTVLDVVNAVAPIERTCDGPVEHPLHARGCHAHDELAEVFASAGRAFSLVTIAQLLDSAASAPNEPPGGAVPVVFACSGCSNAGQLANQVALELDRRGIAEMSCLAGVGAAKATFLKKIQGREVWVIDGCPIECSHGVFELARERVDVHIRLFDLGIRKNVELPTGVELDQLVENVLRHAALQKATRRERSHK